MQQNSPPIRKVDPNFKVVLKMSLERKIYSILLALSVFSFMACGKKVKNSDPNAGKIINRTPALSATNLKLQSSFDTNGSIEDSSFLFQDDAWLTIPELVLLESGSPLNFTVRIFFNTEQKETLLGARELYCEYKAAKQVGDDDSESLDGYYHHFTGCFEDINSDGEPEAINYQPGSQVAQDKDRFVRIEYVSGFTEQEALVSTDIEIEWF